MFLAPHGGTGDGDPGGQGTYTHRKEHVGRRTFLETAWEQVVTNISKSSLNDSNIFSDHWWAATLKVTSASGPFPLCFGNLNSRGRISVQGQHRVSSLAESGGSVRARYWTSWYHDVGEGIPYNCEAILPPSAVGYVLYRRT